MNKWFKLILILVGSSILIWGLYSWVDRDSQSIIKDLTGGPEITPFEMSQTLLTTSEVETALTLKSSLLPQLPHFADQLVQRNFIEKQAGETIIENALSVYDTPQKAEEFITLKAKEAGGARTTRSFESKNLTLMLTSRGSATLRFAVGNLVARITVYGNNKTIDYTNASLLSALTLKLADVEKTKMEQLLSGKLPMNLSLATSNMALRNFPKTITNGQLLGKSPVGADEWLGEGKLTQKVTIPGWVSGAAGVFKLNGNPDQELQVLVIEFKNREAALAEQKTLLTEGAHIEDKTSKEVTLPQSLQKFSLARTGEGIAELQAVKGVYLYDISVIGAADVENLVKYSQEILTGLY